MTSVLVHAQLEDAGDVVFFRSSRSPLGVTLTTPFLVEMITAAEVLNELNQQARSLFVKATTEAFEKSGQTRVDPASVEKIYDAIIGNYFDLFEVSRGSCNCRAESKKKQLPRFILFVAFCCLPPIEQGINQSQLGQSIAAMISTLLDDGTEFVTRILDHARDKVPFDSNYDHATDACIIEVRRRRSVDGLFVDFDMPKE